jgi:hypothetical protein
MEESEMSKKISCFMGLGICLVMALWVSSVWAETMPKGVTMSVLKETPVSHLKGVAKVRLVELRLAPGVKWVHTLNHSGFCTSLKGTITNVNKKGKISTRFPGDTWVMKKGPTLTSYNRGTVEHVQRMWMMIEK